MSDTLTESVSRNASDVSPYEDNFAHLDDELRRLDLRIRLRVVRMSLHNQAFADARAAHAVCISPQEVESLLAQDRAPADDNGTTVASLRAEVAGLSVQIAARVDRSLSAGVGLRLPTLSGLFNLSVLETQAIVVCLAPELSARYDRLYAYLQDDVTRHRPTVNLVLDLLCGTEHERRQVYCHFADTAPLFRGGLLQTAQSTSGCSGLAKTISIDPGIRQYLLGCDDLDARIAEHATFRWPSTEDEYSTAPAVRAGVFALVARRLTVDDDRIHKLVLYLHGPEGVGRRRLARHTCDQLRVSLLSVDIEALLSGHPDPAGALRLAFREALLRQAALHLERADVALRDSGHALLKSLATAVAEYGWLVFLSGEQPWTSSNPFTGAVFESVTLPLLDPGLRTDVWQRELSGYTSDAPQWAAMLGRQFRLTPGLIRAAVETAENHRLMVSPPRALTFADLTSACRRLTNWRLGALAVKIEPRCGWDDLVLPADTVAQLWELCDQVRQRHQVLDSWGFGGKLSHGTGLSVLLSGPPGTGKTMAAEVIAQEVDLDLYKVDLSGVVSKYIGETEKNLARIFAEATSSHAMLFFDEADALFGKRTEVSDAHDRYANIETSFLLQRIEEHEGVVILATNLRENLDDAFTRRIRFAIDFPFPDEASRRRIWRTQFPAPAPVSSDVDLGLLAEQFVVAGGSIKDIALNAAFLAAADGKLIDMDHLWHAARREFDKLGKLWIGR